MKIPGQIGYKQTNRSDILGSLWSSWNLDLQSNLGALRISPRLKLNTSGVDGCPWGFRFFDSKVFAGAGTLIYVGGSTPNSTFTADASSSFQSDYSSDESDMEIFNATLCATTTDALYSKAADGSGTGAWTARDVLNTGGQHVMCFFKRWGRLYYSNLADNIISINDSWSTADPGSDYAISLDPDSNAYTITSMEATSEYIWIGIIDRTGESKGGKILKWDGISAQVTNSYKLNAQGCLALIIDEQRDIPYAVDSNGLILKFNGSGFQEVGRLPVTDKHLTAVNDVDNERFVHPNGISFTREGTLLVAANNKNADTTYNENFQAGVYESDLNGGVAHRYSFTYNPAATSVITDFGQTRVSRIGAIAPMNIYSTTAGRNGTIMAGTTYYTDATSTSSGIFFDDSLDTVQKYGYLVTTKIFSDQLTDVWAKITARIKRLLDDEDKIIIKYRTKDSIPTDGAITWRDTSGFYTLVDISDFAVGDEVEILQGTGSGKTAHIVSITPADASSNVVELDETFEGVTTGTAVARFQKWIKLGQTSARNLDYFSLGTKIESTWIQLKICFQFTGKDELHDVIIDSVDHIDSIKH